MLPGKHYEALPGEQYVDTERSSSTNRRLRLAWTLSTVVTIFCSLFAGYFLGQNSILTSQDGLLLPSGTVHESWQHDVSFSGMPSPETEAAWNSIVPVGRGFVHHDTVAPFISNIAVFHQLHCLHGLRVGYFSTLHNLEVLTGVRDKPDEFIASVGARTDMHHLQHCFDYLRRAIMCAADTNLEFVSRETRVTTGWGVNRVCRDYQSVKVWAERYANSTDQGIL